MTPSRTPVRRPSVDPISGRLRWAADGDDLVAGRYRLRLLERRRWEATHGGRLLGHYTHRSVAQAAMGHHHRERRRIRRIAWWATLAGASLVVAAFVAGRLASPEGFLVFAASVWLFLASVARCVAAVSRNLLDPYRPREPWEPRDWYNRRM
jgi:hypothetical protein